MCMYAVSCDTLVRVYTRSAMEIDGSETHIQEVMSLVLHPLKLSDDLCLGGNSLQNRRYYYYYFFFAFFRRARVSARRARSARHARREGRREGVSRTSRSPRACPRSPEKRKKIAAPVLQAKEVTTSSEDLHN